METARSEMNAMTDKKMLLNYFQIIDIWKRFCEEHNTLFDLTCEEYSTLLDSRIDDLEEIISKKDIAVNNIKALEEIRQELINKINDLLENEKVESVNDLLKVMRDFEDGIGQSHLARFNALLIDIIEKIQLQNKKNQLFLNKAILSLKEIRQDVMGEKTYSTYDQAGRANSK